MFIWQWLKFGYLMWHENHLFNLFCAFFPLATNGSLWVNFLYYKIEINAIIEVIPYILTSKGCGTPLFRSSRSITAPPFLFRTYTDAPLFSFYLIVIASPINTAIHLKIYHTYFLFRQNITFLYIEYNAVPLWR